MAGSCNSYICRSCKISNVWDVDVRISIPVPILPALDALTPASPINTDALLNEGLHTVNAWIMDDKSIDAFNGVGVVCTIRVVLKNVCSMGARIPGMFINVLFLKSRYSFLVLRHTTYTATSKHPNGVPLGLGLSDKNVLDIDVTTNKRGYIAFYWRMYLIAFMSFEDGFG